MRLLRRARYAFGAISADIRGLTSAVTLQSETGKSRKWEKGTSHREIAKQKTPSSGEAEPCCTAGWQSTPASCCSLAAAIRPGPSIGVFNGQIYSLKRRPQPPKAEVNLPSGPLK